MRYSRAALIALLVAVEVLVAGTAVSLLHGGHRWTARAQGMHRLAFMPRSFQAIDAGPSPLVTVSDPDSHIAVTTSTDGRVHVTDRTAARGMVFGAAPRIPDLQVRRTADGVAIERAATVANVFLSFGWFNQDVEIAVPPEATVEIARCSGADVAGLSGQVTVRSQDGAIRLRDLTGNADVSSSDGHIEAHRIRAGRLVIASKDGHLVLDDVAVAQLTATTDDGGIRASGLQIAGANANARVHTNDGSVNLHFADAGNLTVQAHTSDGRIVVDGRSTHSDDDTAQATYTLGSGAGTLDVSTQDGTIAMTTNGAQ